MLESGDQEKNSNPKGLFTWLLSFKILDKKETVQSTITTLSFNISLLQIDLTSGNQNNRDKENLTSTLNARINIFKEDTGTFIKP